MVVSFPKTAEIDQKSVSENCGSSGSRFEQPAQLEVFFIRKPDELHNTVLGMEDCLKIDIKIIFIRMLLTKSHLT